MVEKVQTVSGIFSRSLSASRKHADEAADGDSAGRQGGTRYAGIEQGVCLLQFNKILI